MPEPSRRPCTCRGNQCGKKHGRYTDTLCGAPVTVGVICDECRERQNAKAKSRQHRTPQMADDFGDTSLFGGKGR